MHNRLQLHRSSLVGARRHLSQDSGLAIIKQAIRRARNPAEPRGNYEVTQTNELRLEGYPMSLEAHP